MHVKCELADSGGLDPRPSFEDHTAFQAGPARLSGSLSMNGADDWTRTSYIRLTGAAFNRMNFVSVIGTGDKSAS